MVMVLDEDEFRSGNDPLDSLDGFHVLESSMPSANRQITLRFTTNDNIDSRRYRIWYTDDLTATWTELPVVAFRLDARKWTEKTFGIPGLLEKLYYKIQEYIAGQVPILKLFDFWFGPHTILKFIRLFQDACGNMIRL